MRQVAAQLGGAISAEPAPGGGTLMRLRLPGLEPVQDGADRGAVDEDVTPGLAGSGRPG